MLFVQLSIKFWDETFVKEKRCRAIHLKVDFFYYIKDQVLKERELYGQEEGT